MNGTSTSWKATLRWFALLIAMAAAVGSVSAFFLWSLDAVTRLRFGAPWLVGLLPAGGFAVAWVYRRFGGSANGGTDLLLDEIHQPGPGVPRRMAPLILFGTLVTHLFGGSAGREGTALQLGGGIAAACARWCRDDPGKVSLLLMAGVAAGFGSVFGTPFAGALFAAEVLVVGRIRVSALPPCLLASWVAHGVCLGWGAHHTTYPVAAITGSFTDRATTFAWILPAAIAFGVVARLFTGCSHRVSAVLRRWIPRAEWRPVVGGLMVLAMLAACGNPDYLGLGVLAPHPGALCLPAMFGETGVPATAWLWKFAFTVVTLASGFKGGEVTPLFFIGAALGHAIASAAGVPVDLLAGLGMVAVFAAATKTPAASTLLALELFGPGHGLHAALACIIATWCSGNRGIYAARPSGPACAAP
jgi:H+/Cl- antiporter ClcA